MSYTVKDTTGKEHEIAQKSWKTLDDVLEVLKRNQDTKWYHIHDRRGLSYEQFMYWCKKLELWGFVERVSHGHNQHNGWTGWRVIQKWNDIWFHLTGIPF